MQHALGRLDFCFLYCAEANLLGQTLACELLAVEPRISRSESGAAMNFILNRLVNREHIALLAELDPYRWPDSFCQSEIGIRVEQDQRQRLSSP